MVARGVPLKRLLVDLGLAPTEERAEGLILSGLVRVNGHVVSQAGTSIPSGAEVVLDTQKLGVSRAGVKLAEGLKIWKIQVAGRVCADVGASTGGFTEVLLRSGASKVFAIDVGYGELAWSLRNDPRVVVMERTNAREVKELTEKVSFCCVDVSFISVRLILPNVLLWMDQQGGSEIVVLVKPQFEAKRDQVPRGGVITNPVIHREVLNDFYARSIPAGLFLRGLIRSPIKGTHGNSEFLAWLGTTRAPDLNVDMAIEQALKLV